MSPPAPPSTREPMMDNRLDTGLVCTTCRWRAGHSPDCPRKDEPWPTIEVPEAADEITRLNALCDPDRLFAAIAHGDDEHRTWLKDATAAYFAGQAVPPARGSGRKEAEITRLNAENAELRAALEEVINSDSFLLSLAIAKARALITKAQPPVSHD